MTPLIQPIPAAVHYTPQTLSAAQAAQARVNIGTDRFNAVLANDFTVSSSTTYTTATGMSFTLTAGTWVVEYFAVFGDVDNTNGHKTILDFGAVSCLRATTGMYGNTGFTEFTLMFPWPDTGVMSNEASSGAGFQFGGQHITVMVVVPSTAVISLQMAQQSSGANGAVMKAGSWMTARRSN